MATINTIAQLNRSQKRGRREMFEGFRTCETAASEPGVQH